MKEESDRDTEVHKQRIKDQQILSLKNSPAKSVLKQSSKENKTSSSNVLFKLVLTVSLCILVIFLFALILVYDLS